MPGPRLFIPPPPTQGTTFPSDPQSWEARVLNAVRGLLTADPTVSPQQWEAPGYKWGALAGAALPLVAGIRAFHGSPKNFDKFTRQRGMQTEGAGLYFSDNPAIAEGYRPPGGTAYEVDLKVDPSELLNLDQPYSAQPERMQQALQAVGLRNEVFPVQEKFGRYQVAGGDYQGSPASGAYATAEEAQAAAQQARDTAPLTQWIANVQQRGVGDYEPALRARGIPGATYRAREGPGQNYVMYDDALIEILRKYGILAPLLAPQVQQQIIGTLGER